MPLMVQWHQWVSWNFCTEVHGSVCMFETTAHREHSSLGGLNYNTLVTFKHYFNINLAAVFLLICVCYSVLTVKNTIINSLIYWSIYNTAIYLSAWLVGDLEMLKQIIDVTPLRKHYMPNLNAPELHRWFCKTDCWVQFPKVHSRWQLLSMFSDISQYCMSVQVQTHDWSLRCCFISTTRIR